MQCQLPACPPTFLHMTLARAKGNAIHSTYIGLRGNMTPIHPRPFSHSVAPEPQALFPNSGRNLRHLLTSSFRGGYIHLRLINVGGPCRGWTCPPPPSPFLTVRCCSSRRGKILHGPPLPPPPHTHTSNLPLFVKCESHSFAVRNYIFQRRDNYIVLYSVLYSIYCSHMQYQYL